MDFIDDSNNRRDGQFNPIISFYTLRLRSVFVPRKKRNDQMAVRK